MHRDLVTARPHSDRERVALLALKHNLKAIPIVDKDGHFLGVVPSDTILDILHTESIEDTLKAAGIHSSPEEHDAILASKTGVNVRRRLPWLIAGLLGGFGAAGLVRTFEEALSADLLLAAFIPTIVYMADAVGTQVQTVLIRALAVEHDAFPLRRYFRREAAVNIVLSVLLGVLAGLIGAFFFNAPQLGVILGLSLLATILAASAVAATLPFLMLRFRVDPAVASGPLATIIRDLMSLLIYFLIARALL
jgi:magnesium transporter